MSQIFFSLIVQYCSARCQRPQLEGDQYNSNSTHNHTLTAGSLKLHLQEPRGLLVQDPPSYRLPSRALRQVTRMAKSGVSKTRLCNKPGIPMSLRSVGGAKLCSRTATSSLISNSARKCNCRLSIRSKAEEQAWKIAPLWISRMLQICVLN